jgi:hypothetical protein
LHSIKRREIFFSLKRAAKKLLTHAFRSLSDNVGFIICKIPFGLPSQDFFRLCVQKLVALPSEGKSLVKVGTSVHAQTYDFFLKTST